MTSVGTPKLLERIRCLGWSPDNNDPRATYRRILDAVGSEYDGEIQLVQEFNQLQVDPDRPDTIDPDHYFEMLDWLYDIATTRHRHIHFHLQALSYFLEGIREKYPLVYHRHKDQIVDQSFTWNSLFRQVVLDAMSCRFGDYPARLAESYVRVLSGGQFLGGMRISQFWEFVTKWALPQDEPL